MLCPSPAIITLLLFSINFLIIGTNLVAWPNPQFNGLINMFIFVDVYKRQGKCSNCGEWNTIEEQIINKTDVKSNNLLTISPKLIQEINYDNFERISLPSDELNRILGGGLTRGSIILLAGEPGIGKTTLLMQELMKIKDFTVLYVSGEESLGCLLYTSGCVSKPSWKTTA